MAPPGPELVWDCPRCTCGWLGASTPPQHASAPIAGSPTSTQHRLACASRSRCPAPADRDRPTRRTTWPGEEPQPAQPETPIIDRDEEFVAFVIADVNRRAEAEARSPPGADEGTTGRLGGRGQPKDAPMSRGGHGRAGSERRASVDG